MLRVDELRVTKTHHIITIGNQNITNLFTRKPVTRKSLLCHYGIFHFSAVYHCCFIFWVCFAQIRIYDLGTIA